VAPKPVRHSVAAVVRRLADDRFLAVRRPPDDDLLPDFWGLPAVTLAPGELPEAGLRRVGREKLGVTVEPVRLIGIRAADRGTYELILLEFEARLVEGEPDVQLASTAGTRYVEQRWTDQLDLLRPAAHAGSLCCRILLDAEAAPTADDRHSPD
jgi:ADP-ribose pyrophosphatase YjhB (NUDIX family)